VNPDRPDGADGPDVEGGLAETRSTYDAIAPAYDERRPAQLTGWLADLFDALLVAAPPAGTLLDAGCGPGHDVGLARARGRQAVGLDLSAGMLARARRRVGPPLVQADVRMLPFRSASVAAVWSAYALPHVPRERLPEVAAEVARVLVPGGMAALTYAGGDAVRREEVPYAPGLFRHFAYIRPADMAAAVRGAGLLIEADGRPAGAHRGAGWVLARRPRG